MLWGGQAHGTKASSIPGNKALLAPPSTQRKRSRLGAQPPCARFSEGRDGLSPTSEARL